jgi:hypothetical protein
MKLEQAVLPNPCLEEEEEEEEACLIHVHSMTADAGATCLWLVTCLKVQKLIKTSSEVSQ